jgi:hypothetical protein
MIKKLPPTIQKPLIFVVCGLAVLIGYWLIDYTTVRGALCQPGEIHCWRKWIGALSGWVAALGAFFTIWVLYKQLTIMRRQTEYAVGDAPPTLAVVRNEDWGLQLRVVNWNRNTVRLNKYVVRRSDEPNPITGVTVLVPIDGKLAASDSKDGTYFPVDMDGWEDRKDSPPARILQLHIGKHDKDISVVCTLDITINDVSSRNIEIKASAIHAGTLPADRSTGGS